MAEKNTFIAYKDWRGTFDALPDEMAGKLVKHLFALADGEESVDDPVMVALLSQFKAVMKKDQEKWEQQIEQRREAGKKSAQARKGKKEKPSKNPNEGSEPQEGRGAPEMPTKMPRKKPSRKKVIESKIETYSELPEEFRNEAFAEAWKIWLQEKWDQHKFQYKSKRSEIMAANELYKLSGGDIVKAGEIIAQSMSNGWKGLFELKVGAESKNSDVQRRFDEELQKEMQKQREYEQHS